MDKRAAIIEAARNRFRTFGIRKTAIHEIAADAGVAVGTIYLYFKNKDNLILGCAERFAEQHKEFAESVLSSKLAPPEKLRKYIIGRFRAVEETRTGSRFVVDIARAVIKLNPARFEQDEKWLHDNVCRILQEGVSSGTFFTQSPEREARIFVQSMAYFLPVAGMEPFRPPREAKMLEMVDWFIEVWSRKPSGSIQESNQGGGKQ